WTPYPAIQTCPRTKIACSFGTRYKPSRGRRGMDRARAQAFTAPQRTLARARPAADTDAGFNAGGGWDCWVTRHPLPRPSGPGPGASLWRVTRRRPVLRHARMRRYLRASPVLAYRVHRTFDPFGHATPVPWTRTKQGVALRFAGEIGRPAGSTHAGAPG